MRKDCLLAAITDIFSVVKKNFDFFYWVQKTFASLLKNKNPVLPFLALLCRAKFREVRIYCVFSVVPLRAPERKFFILATPRSGSNLLRSLLNAHPAIQCDGEVWFFRTFSPKVLVRGLASLSKKEVYGFKCFVKHIVDDQAIGDLPDFVSGLYREGWKVILLTRGNFFKQAVSLCIARATSRWVYSRKQSLRRQNKVYIPPKLLLCFIRQYELDHMKQSKIRSTVSCLSLEYDRDLLDPASHQKTANAVCSYLGVAPAAVSTRMRKQADRPLAELVSNYTEVCEAVRQTRFASFLESGD